MAWLEVYKGYYAPPIGARRFAARERDAARRCTGMIYGSDWAKGDAVKRFDVAPERVHVQPMGAAWVSQAGDKAVQAAVTARPRNRLELLFVAKEWERKGGPLALEIARGLRDSGRVGEVRLNVVGVRPQLALTAFAGYSVELLDPIGVPGIWFPFGIGVSRTQYIYGVLIPIVAILVVRTLGSSNSRAC